MTNERENDRKFTDASGVAAKGNVFISDVRGQVRGDMNESSKIDNNVRISVREFRYECDRYTTVK